MTSKKPRKQRKKHFESKKHERYKKMTAKVDIEEKEVKRRPVKTGDKVKVMRGDHKGEEGEVMNVDLDNYKINVEGVKRIKQDGEEIPIPIHPSNVKIIREAEEEK